MNAREGVEKNEHSYSAGRNVNWYSYYGKDKLGVRDKQIYITTYIINKQQAFTV